jgi:pyrroline-5-carboxylate reductase
MSEATAFPGRVAIIGGGRMGEAILAGLLAAHVIAAEAVTVAEPDSARRDALANQYGVACAGTALEAAVTGDVVLLAVKPQVIDAVVESIASGVAGRLVVSIAAGISTARLEALLPEGTAVVRVMPNTPALVREGVSVISGGRGATAEQVETVRTLFSAVGEAIVLDERYQDAATAISGSGPAYFALVVDSLARAGVRHGLTREVAEKLAVATMRGTARLIGDTGQHPQAVIDAVSSPGGTTIAALEAMERGGLRTALADGVSAAVKRARELGQ